MNKYATMTAEFDRDKKIRAAAYTAAIAAGLLLIVWFVKFYQPVVPPPPPEVAIEIALPDPPPVEDINLGNNDVGSGKVQPIVTGNPSSAPVSQDVTPSKGVTSQQATKDFDEDDDKHSPPITKPTTTNTSKEVNNNATEQSEATKPQLRRGAQMTSTRGSGNGGNTDLPGMNKPGSQGPGDGPGDKGTVNGDPNGRKYIAQKNVRFTLKNSSADFKEGGTIVLEINVNENGTLLSSKYQITGSSLPKSSTQYSLALESAKEQNYPKIAGGFKQKLKFEFSVN
jgi:hypothetical protein